MTEAEWLTGKNLEAMVKWFREEYPRDNRLDRFVAAYCGWPYDHLSPQVLSAGTYPDGRQFLWLVQADDHDCQRDEPWGPANGLPLLRCFFGNLFRPITLDPAFLTSTVLALARQMYESRDFGAMPILAGALQEAGCENADVLDHCRDRREGVPGEPVGGSPTPQTHVRGCWVIDLLLGKQ